MTTKLLSDSERLLEICNFQVIDNGVFDDDTLKEFFTLLPKVNEVDVLLACILATVISSDRADMIQIILNQHQDLDLQKVIIAIGPHYKDSNSVKFLEDRILNGNSLQGVVFHTLPKIETRTCNIS
jgi:hypothetical protein